MLDELNSSPNPERNLLLWRLLSCGRHWGGTGTCWDYQNSPKALQRDLSNLVSGWFKVPLAMARICHLVYDIPLSFSFFQEIFLPASQWWSFLKSVGVSNLSSSRFCKVSRSSFGQPLVRNHWQRSNLSHHQWLGSFEILVLSNRCTVCLMLDSLLQTQT